MRSDLTLAAVAAVLLAGATPALAQARWNHPAIHVTSTVNVQSGIRDSGSQDRRIFLFRLRHGTGGALTGIDQQVWDGTDAVGAWGSWAARTNPDVKGEGPFGTSLAAAAGEILDGGVWKPRFQAAFDYRNATSPPSSSAAHKLGLPSWLWLNNAFTWLDKTPPANSNGSDLQPWTTFSWKNGSTFRMNVFGLTFPGVPSPSLREAWFNGGVWQFTDHGRPTPDVTTEIRIGPHSAAWTEPMGTGRGYVFVSGNDGLGHHHLYVNYFGPGCSGTPTGWCWNDLGAPGATVDMRTPTALVTTAGNRRRVEVFVTVKTENTWHLWSRFSDDAMAFGDWIDQGAPPGLDASSYTTAGFDMSVGVVYDQNGVQRTNLFGTTTPFDVASSGLTAHGGGELIERYTDTAGPHWGLQVQPPGMQFNDVEDEATQWTGPRFQTMSASVVDTRSWERISVFGEDELGRIWELAWTGASWDWKVH